ncbi:hypothetical protein GCM10010149_88010 [Nonomuraea roseoviolacea subsp. roseoviolacea]|uniref:DUF397 domain-containing protein n=1 Tax=Nonomuraea roseoviolacea TaxID=103837 RepID=UPI0031DF43C6
MIIQDQGLPVLVHDEDFVSASNGGGNCAELAKAEVPAGHRKHGRGPVVALRDDENRAGPVVFLTAGEMDALAESWLSGKFDHLRK